MNGTKNYRSPRRRCRHAWFAICGVTLLGIILVTTNALSAPVMEEEAVAVADLWYAMELKAPYLHLAPEQKSARLTALQERHIYYLVSEQELMDTDPGKRIVLAYVVEYKPTGFVVVSGDDELSPIVVFSVESHFRWDQPKRNFLRYFLVTTMTENFNCIARAAQEGVQSKLNPNWEILRAKMAGGEPLEEAQHVEAPEPIFVLLETALWDQCWPYNVTVYTVHGLTIDCIPTGCVATALAVKLRFHEWPLSGTGANSYNDTWGFFQMHHNVNYGDQTYNFDNMPTGDLTTANDDVADLMYHCGVGVETNYEGNCIDCTGPGSGSDTWTAATALNSYFRYIETEWKMSDHFDHMKRSIRAGLPVVCGPHGHTVVADGYRETPPYFHINCCWSGNCNAWYNLNNVPNNPPNCSSGGAIGCSCPYGQPSNYKYVDKDYTGADERGTVKEPYSTFADGYTNCPDEGHLWLKGSKTYLASPTILSKKMTIHSYEGDATVEH